MNNALIRRRQLMNMVKVSEAEGNPVVFNTNTVRGFAGLKIYGKGEQVKTDGNQLFDISNSITNEEKNGINLTVNSGFIILNGTANQSTDFYFSNFFDSLSVGEYTIKINNIINGMTAYLNLSTGMTFESDGVLNFEKTSETQFIYFIIRIASGTTFSNKEITIMLNAGSSPLPWEPYTGGHPSPSVAYPQDIQKPGESGQIQIDVLGSQLLDPGIFIEEVTNRGVTIKNNKDSIFYISGTNDGTGVVNLLNQKTFVLQPGTYTTSGSEQYAFLALNYLEGDSYKYINGNKTFTISEAKEINSYIQVISGYSGEISLKPMINSGSSALPWEPYKTPQSLIAQTPNGLPGIPVNSGGNYIDESGQQWISDYVDYESREHVQCVNQKIFDGSDDENWSESTQLNNRFIVPIVDAMVSINGIGMCTSADFVNNGTDIQNQCTIDGAKNFYINTNIETLEEWKTHLSENPMMVIYVLATPIVTDLPAEETASYNALHTNAPTTTIINDADVWVKAKYKVRR